jgi:hypothetical protein
MHGSLICCEPDHRRVTLATSASGEADAGPTFGHRAPLL